MKIKRSNLKWISTGCQLLAAGVLLALPVSAANRWWDGGTTDLAGNGDGASGGGTGTWDTTLLNWDQGNGLPYASWVNGNNDVANFAGTVGTVTLGADDITVGGIVAGGNGYVIAGNGRNLTINGTGNTVVMGAGSGGGGSLSGFNTITLGGNQTWKPGGYSSYGISLSVSDGTVDTAGYTLTLGVNSSEYTAVASLITGAGGVNVYGNSISSALYNLGNNPVNTYTGVTTLNGYVKINNGLKNVGVPSVFGAATSADPTNIILNAGGLMLNSVAGSTDRGMTLIGNCGFWAKGSLKPVLAGRITGTGSLTVYGDYNGGTAVILAGANDFSGSATAGPDGTLRLGHIYAISNATLNTSVGARGAIDLTSSNLDYVIGGITGTNNLNLGTGSVSIGNNNGSTTYSGALTGGALTKTGTGTLTISGTISNSSLTINGGTLALSGSGSVASANLALGAAGTLSATARTDGTLALAIGQTLGGNGTLAGDLTVNGSSTISPGASVGTLTDLGNVTWNGGGNYKWEISGTSAGNQDLLDITGALTSAATSGSPFNLNIVSLDGSGSPGALASGFDPNVDQSWKIATASGGVTGLSSDAFNITDHFTAYNGGSGTFVVTNIGNDVLLVYKHTFVAVGPSANLNSPTSATVWMGGGPVTFSITPGGTAPLALQWYHGAVLLTGQTNSSLTLTNCQLADAGSYTCVVTNQYAPYAATSAPAVLAVNRFVVLGQYRLGEDGVGVNNRPLDSTTNGYNFIGDQNGGNAVMTTANPAPDSTHCYVFDGTCGFVGNGWTPLTDNVGIECWVRVGDLAQSGKQIFGTGSRGGAGGGMSIVYDGAIKGANGTSGAGEALFGLPYTPAGTDQWVHVAVVRASGVERLYINGQPAGAPAAGGPSASNEPVMGMYHGSGYTGFFNGAIDEAQIFAFAAGQFQVTDLGCYQNLPPGTLIHPKPWFDPGPSGLGQSAYNNAYQFVNYSGWDDLWNRYGGILPFGVGVTVAQVENGTPPPANFPDKTFVLDPPGGVDDGTGHANTVGSILYGSGYVNNARATYELGFGRGISSISAYTGDAFRADVLQIPAYNSRNGSLPAWNNNKCDVVNLSNSGGFGGEDNTIRAWDYLLDAGNVLGCTAMPGSGSPYNQELSGNLWNGMVVGQNGPRDNGYNGTQFENVGSYSRVKPDLVTADYIGGRTGGASSWGTPTVASGAAFLLEQARSTSLTAHATNNYVLKAIMLAGASKQGLVSPMLDPTLSTGYYVTNWDLITPYVYSNNPPAQPLDRFFGAGLFNINNAYTILTAGEQSQAVTNADTGWAQGIGLNAGAAHTYWIAVTHPATEFSALLVCNRHIQDDPNNPGYGYVWNVTELKLELYDAGNHLLASSDDPGNNVNQVWLPNGLADGLYYLKVSNVAQHATGGTVSTNENYGLAWRTTAPDGNPMVALTSPTNGQVMAASDIPLTAGAVANNYNLGAVQYYADGVPVAASGNSPVYSASWTGAAVGAHSLTAVLSYQDPIFGSTLTVTSAPVNITVTAALSPVTITGAGKPSAGSFQLTFTGAEGQSYHVLSTNVLTAPLADWPAIANGTIGAGGIVIFTDPAATNRQQFYRVVSP